MSEGLDPMTDGRPWEWGVAAALTVALLLPLVPLLAVVGAACRMADRRRP